MTKIDLTKLTSEALQIEAKKRNTAFTSFIIIFVLLIGVSIFLTIKNGFGVFTILPITFIALVVAMKKGVDEIKKEIESRKL